MDENSLFFDYTLAMLPSCIFAIQRYAHSFIFIIIPAAPILGFPVSILATSGMKETPARISKYLGVRSARDTARFGVGHDYESLACTVC